MKKKYLVCAAIMSACASISQATTVQVLHTFFEADGIAPETGLTIDSTGNLYGVTMSTIFKVSTTGTNFSVLHTFDSSVGSVGSALLLGPDSMLYGATTRSNTSDGTIFKMSTAGTFTSLASFNGSNGSGPYGSLISDGLGNVVGTCYGGGTGNAGTVFKEATSGGSITDIANFATATTGAAPYSGLVQSNDNYLYGTTSSGGNNGTGTIYKVPMTGGAISKLADFTSSVGSDSETNLITNGYGTFFGTTNMGGAYNKGTIFDYSSGSGLGLLGTFNGVNGSYIEGALLADATGNMYGTTVTGGSNFGTVYEISRAGGTINTLVAFNGSSSIYPYSTLVADSTGSLYGTTEEGVATGGTGTVFKVLNSGYIPVSAVVQSVSNGQTVQIAAGTVGIQLTSLYSVIISNGGHFVLNASSSSTNRRLLVVGQGGLSIGVLTSGVYGGSLDLTNNDLEVVGGSLTVITNQIRQGFANGVGNSSGGITSSTASADPKHLHALGIIQNNQTGALLFIPSHEFDGYTPGPADILIKYTYFGDANLDGQVDGSDYSLIDSGFLFRGTTWFDGDFNYDGIINGSDYTLIDNAFNAQGASFVVQAATTTEIALNVSVPEPTSMSALIISGVGLLSVRRKTRSSTGSADAA